MANNKKIAEEVLAAVGGKENVTNVTHCMTRLRFTLKDQFQIRKLLRSSMVLLV